MITIKLKFRPSSLDGKEGCLYFQIVYNRMVRQISTDYRVYASEWDDAQECVVIDGERRNLLSGIRERLDWDYARLDRVVARLESSRHRFTVDDVVHEYHRLTQEMSLFSFMHGVIAQLKQLGRQRTAETYSSTLKSFQNYRCGEDVPLDAISSDLMLLYEAWLKARGVRLNTISFYMRILRAVYNRAVDRGLTVQCHPFRHVYTGVEKTMKRAISVKYIKIMKRMNLTGNPALDFARDMFLFSFYTRGMSFIDMAHLRKTDLQHGELSYCRRKTGQRLAIKWERCMEELVCKYDTSQTPYLLPILKKEDDTRRYTNVLHLVNSRLKQLSMMLRLPRPITMYVARHSWASTAKAKNIPISVISEGMGHDSETTTQIYLASLETSVVDRANRKILDLLKA